MINTVLKEQAYNEIKNMLLTGEILPGSRIREDRLAVELEMSRTPVREAVNQLAKSGFVDIVVRHGVFAATISKKNLMELTAVREALSVLAVRGCCSRITDGEIRELEDVLRKYEKACEAQDPHERGMMDGLYHKTIARFSGNDILCSMLCDVEDRATYARNMSNYRYDRTDSIRVHREILDALQARDEERAIDAMRRNVNHLYVSMD